MTEADDLITGCRTLDELKAPFRVIDDKAGDLRNAAIEQRRAELQASSAKREPSIRVAYDSFRKAAL